MSDGWGDAAGIEGNYEETDDGDAADDGETSGTNSMGETSETNKVNETSETNAGESPDDSRTNIKDEWNGRTIYVPDGVLEDLEDTYLESQLKLRRAGREEFKKNRHFYPLVVQLGLEALGDADADEIQSRLSELHD